ncbi:hypothetical protein FB451DRAFT_1379978 [Mycena latifolia]|nr:hypothetical protein FB451DRAFT_1379978 [Mycena latifolia]
MDHGPRMHLPGAVPRLVHVLNLAPMVRLAMPLSATRPSKLMCDADDSQEPPKKKAKPSGHRRKGTRGPPAPTRPNPWMPPSAGVSTSNVPSAPSVAANLNPEAEACFPMEDMTEDAEEELDRLEREGFARHEQSHPGPQPPASQPAAPFQATPSTADLLKQAARRSNSREYIYTGIIRVNLHSVDMFFSKREVFACDAESEDEGMDSENEEDETEPRNSARRIEPSLSGEKAWFKQPKGMPAWLYQFFRDTVQPLLFAKEGGKLLRPSIFSINNVHAPASFWIHPVEPVVALEGYQFDPPMLYQPRVFLWLPHFFVQRLNCPNCRTGKLEKNGALTPRRITDCDSSFYIVSWAYYCRDSCKSYYHGWSQRLLDSIPAYLRLSFPAVLSRKTGLSRNVLAMLRVGNQHKMGPSGTRAMLYEMHTLRYNRLLLQYLESAFERERGLETLESTSLQSTLHVYGSASYIPPFGDFANPQGYDGFVPSASYLTSMINKAIEKDEPDADQHTSCLPPDQTDIDDSHKITKHIANEDGVPIFGALWTCMTSRYIRAQALTLTKSHEERIGPLMGIAKSAKRYGFGEPLVAYSDDPVKDKSMLCAAFPSLAENLTPIAVAHGLESLSLPATVKITYLDSISLVQDAFKSFVAALDADQQAHLCVSLDAEWNMSRRVGVSVLQIAPHLSPNTIYIIPVFLVGSSIQGDLTRLKKQFSQLDNQTFNTIDLKQFAIQRGLITKKDSGSLDVLAEKLLGVYLSKDSSLRQCENWEDNISHRPELLNYAALDVYASRLIFEKISEKAPLECVQHDTAPGTRVAMLTREGGEIAAYGQISAVQTSTFAGIRVKTSNNSRVLVDIDSVLIPAAAAILHVPPSSSSGLSLLQFDRRPPQSISAGPSAIPNSEPQLSGPPPAPQPTVVNATIESLEEEDSDDIAPDNQDEIESDLTDETLRLQMLKSHAQAGSPSRLEDEDVFDSSPLGRGLLDLLRKVSNSPDETQECYTRIKKDIFHAFHMIPLSSSHGLRAVFLRTLRDHMMRWDPVIRAKVDETCRKVFKVGFDVMLLRHPRFIKERTPRYIPPPSVLVPAIQHVFNIFGNARDAESGQPLFNKTAWQKANAVLELAREGYLSDPVGVVLYEKAGVDEHGLQKYSSTRGTNKLEGGPHGDIYRKFGALHGAEHGHGEACFRGVDWEYHHDIGFINRTSFLLNYLSDIINGAESYLDWMNPDLYERTTEKFGVCPVPELLRSRFEMASFDETTAARFKLNSNNDWLRRRQAVALPILPPNTPEARKYFFSKIGSFVAEASASGKCRVNYNDFAREWNRSADGKDRYYVTPDVLSAYAKSWDKTNNARASQELIAAKMDLVRQTGELFRAPSAPFPTSLIGDASVAHPRHGVIDLMATDSDGPSVPSSIDADVAISRPRITVQNPDQLLDRRRSTHSLTQPQTSAPALGSASSSHHSELNLQPPVRTAQSGESSTDVAGSIFDLDGRDPSQDYNGGPPDPNLEIQTGSSSVIQRENSTPGNVSRRRTQRLASGSSRQRGVRSCRRCHRDSCPGNSDIDACEFPCTVPCKKCGQTLGCKGVDHGRRCTYSSSS